MSLWDDITNAISEIDDYVVGAGKYVVDMSKGVLSAFIDDGQLFTDPNAKQKKNKGPVSALAEDWFNDSAKAKELTFNVIDTPVNFTLNNYSANILASNLMRQNPEKYSGANGYIKAKEDAEQLAFGNRQGLAWYEQDPNRVQFGEAYIGNLDKNAPITKSFEERQQYWASVDRLDDVMWTTLGAMIIADPLNFIPGGQAKNVDKINDIQNVIDALNDAKTTDEAMDIVRGFNWQDRLPRPIDVENLPISERKKFVSDKYTLSDFYFGPESKRINPNKEYNLNDIEKIKKDLYKLRNLEIRKAFDEVELEKIQREIALIAAAKKESLVIKGTPKHLEAVAEAYLTFRPWDNLPEDIKSFIPKSNKQYFSHGGTVWSTDGKDIFEWVPRRTKKVVDKKTKVSKEIIIGGKWRPVSVLPAYKFRTIKELAKPNSELITRFEQEVGSTEIYDYIKFAAQPAEDSAILNVPLYGLPGRDYLVRSGKSRTIEDAFGPGKPGKTVSNFDPANTRIIELLVDTKAGPRKVQVAITPQGTFHLDSIKQLVNPVEDLRTPEQINLDIDKIVYKDIDPEVDLLDQEEQLLKNLNSLSSEKKKEVANNLYNRLNKVLVAIYPERVTKWITYHSDPEVNVDDILKTPEQTDKLKRYQERFNFDTGEWEEIDLIEDDYLSDYFYRELDNTSVNEFGDEFGDGLDDAFSTFDQGINVVKEPKVKTNEPYVSSKRELVWAFNPNFPWSKVKGYSLTFVNPVTGSRTKTMIDNVYKVINPVEVSKGEMPKLIQVKVKPFAPHVENPVTTKSDTVWTFGAGNELIPVDEVLEYQKIYEDNIIKAQLEVEHWKQVLANQTGSGWKRDETKRLKPISINNDIVDRRIADETYLEELKMTDPYAYQSMMENAYGVPRKVSFMFKRADDGYGSIKLSLVRITQEIKGYGDEQSLIGDPAEEIVYTWTLTPKDIKEIHSVLFNPKNMAKHPVSPVGFNSKYFDEVFLGIPNLVDSPIGQPIYKNPITLDYKDLDRFGEPRWESNVATYEAELKRIEERLVKLQNEIALNRTYTQRYKGMKYREDSVRTNQAALKNMLKERRELLKQWHNVRPNWQSKWDMDSDFVGPKFEPPTPDFGEYNFMRWINALNYTFKTKVGILDNLPMQSYDLEAIRKSTAAMAAEMRNAPTELKPTGVQFASIADDPKGIFVFGSNLAGRHGKGAALDAKNTYGAEYGVGRGLTGRAYAIPTKDENLKPVRLMEIEYYVKQFLDFAEKNPDKTFYVTSFGSGLAGNKVEDIAKMFDRLPDNIRFTPEPDGSPNRLGTAISKLNATDETATVESSKITTFENELVEPLPRNLIKKYENYNPTMHLTGKDLSTDTPFAGTILDPKVAGLREEIFSYDRGQIPPGTADTIGGRVAKIIDVFGSSPNIAGHVIYYLTKEVGPEIVDKMISIVANSTKDSIVNGKLNPKLTKELRDVFKEQIENNKIISNNMLNDPDLTAIDKQYVTDDLYKYEGNAREMFNEVTQIIVDVIQRMKD